MKKSYISNLVLFLRFCFETKYRRSAVLSGLRKTSCTFPAPHLQFPLEPFLLLPLIARSSELTSWNSFCNVSFFKRPTNVVKYTDRRGRLFELLKYYRYLYSSYLTFRYIVFKLNVKIRVLYQYKSN